MESCIDNVVFTMLPSSKDLILLCSMTLKYMHINLWIWVHLKVDFSLCEDWFIACSTFREVWNVYQYFYYLLDLKLQFFTALS